MTQDNGMDTSPSWQQLHDALDDLQACEARYRQLHDRQGCGMMATGQAWDRLRSAGHRARQLIHEHRRLAARVNPQPMNRALISG